MGLHKIPSLKLILQKVNKNDEEGYIYLRAGIPGTKRYVTKGLGRKLPVKHWDDENEFVKKSFPDHQRYNELNESEKKRVQAAFDEEYKSDVRFVETNIRHIMFPVIGQDDFIAFWQDYIDNLKATKKKREGTIAVWDTEIKQFSEFVGGSISFKAITTAMLNKYHQKLTNFEVTTQHKKLKKLLQIVNSAVKQELITPKQIAGFEMIKYVAPETDYLTFDELKKIENKLYYGEYDNNETLRRVAAYFLMSSYSAIRFSDWDRFKVEKLIHNRNFKVTTTKNNKPVYLPLDKFKSLATILDYIDKNGLVCRLSEAKVNEYLKLIKPGLCAHDARRTFATLHGELGYTTRWIAKVMAVTERTAMGYIKATEQGFENEIAKNGAL